MLNCETSIFSMIAALQGGVQSVSGVASTAWTKLLAHLTWLTQLLSRVSFQGIPVHAILEIGNALCVVVVLGCVLLYLFL